MKWEKVEGAVSAYWKVAVALRRNQGIITTSEAIKACNTGLFINPKHKSLIVLLQDIQSVIVKGGKKCVDQKNQRKVSSVSTLYIIKSISITQNCQEHID